MALLSHGVPTRQVSGRADGAAVVDADDEAGYLRWLIRRIADDDRDAFGELFTRVSGPVLSVLLQQVTDPVRVAGVVAGTFVEVWWLAGGRVDPDTDVMAWITGIVGRRVADSCPLALFTDLGGETRHVLTALWAQRIEAELARLLAHTTTS